MKAKARRLLLLLLVAFVFPGIDAAEGGGGILVQVKVVSASNIGKRVDPALRGLAKQLSSLFNYSSYRLLTTKDLGLRIGEQGVVKLPGRKSLKIIAKEISGGRVRLLMNLEKEGEIEFSTTTRLASGKSVLIGGPKYKGKVLIFSISTRF